MRRDIRVRGEQREELELERLAHALLEAAREAARARTADEPDGEEEHEVRRGA